MRPMENPERRRTLFLTYLYPSFFGTGAQIRSAALVRMLAAREDVHLLVIQPRENNPAVRDAELDNLCKKIEFIPLTPAGEPGGLAPEKPQLIGPIRRFYEENQLNSLFVFRIESCFFLTGGVLNTFPRRYLDLDELTSRRINMLEQLKSISGATTTEPADRRLQMVIRMMEKDFIPRFQKTFVSSEVEAAEARRLTGFEHVHVLPNIYPRRQLLPPSPASTPREILFVGTFSHFPNVDAVLYFHRAILPLIRRRLAEEVVFRVVGSPRPESIGELAQDPAVQLMGYQKDLEPHYARASLAVAPLRAGAGTRIKILEAFSYGRPVVSTSISAAGLDVVDGENILLADAPEDFALACVKILESPGLAARLVANGRRLHEEHYSAGTLLRLYDDAMADNVLNSNP